MKNHLSVLLLTLFLFSCNNTPTKVEQYSEHPPSPKFTDLTTDFSIWDKQFDNLKRDESQKVISTQDGSYILVGSTTSTSKFNDRDMIILKLDNEGNELWRKQYGEPKSSEFGYDILEMKNGDFLVLTAIMNKGHYQGFQLLRYGKEGNLIWEKGHMRDQNLKPSNILLTNDSQILIGGTLFEKFKNHGYLIWLDENGDKIKDQKYGGRLFNNGELSEYEKKAIIRGPFLGEYFNKIIQTTDNNYFAIGKSKSNSSSLGWLVKISSTGELLWDKKIKESIGKGIVDIFENEKNELILIGDSYDSNTDKLTFLMLKYNQQGKLLKEKHYSAEKHYQGIRGIPLPSDDMILVGVIDTAEIMKRRNILTNSISKEKKEEYINDGWQLNEIGSIGGSQVERLSKTIPLTKKEEEMNRRRNQDVWLCKVDSSGEIIWEKTIGGTGHENLFSLDLDKNNNLVLSGYSTKNVPNFNSSDIWVFKMVP